MIYSDTVESILQSFRTLLYMVEYEMVRMNKAMAVKISSFGLVCIYGIMSEVSYTCLSMTKSLIWSCEKMMHVPPMAL